MSKEGNVTVEMWKADGCDDAQLRVFEDWLRENSLQSVRVNVMNLYGMHRFGVDICFMLDNKYVPRTAEMRLVCADLGSEAALHYAISIDEGPHEVTRLAACRCAGHAYRYALEVDQSARPDTRAAACRRALCAFMYASHVDKRPRYDTREATLDSAMYAHYYAHTVDRSAREDTRDAACADPAWAFTYARDVDKKEHPKTRSAVDASPYYRKEYNSWLLQVRY